MGPSGAARGAERSDTMGPSGAAGRAERSDTMVTRALAAIALTCLTAAAARAGDGLRCGSNLGAVGALSVQELAGGGAAALARSAWDWLDSRSILRPEDTQRAALTSSFTSDPTMRISFVAALLPFLGALVLFAIGASPRSGAPATTTLGSFAAFYESRIRTQADYWEGSTIRAIATALTSPYSIVRSGWRRKAGMSSSVSSAP